MIRTVVRVPQLRVELYYSAILWTLDAEVDGCQVQVRDCAGVADCEGFAVDGFDWVPDVDDLLGKVC